MAITVLSLDSAGAAARNIWSSRGQAHPSGPRKSGRCRATCPETRLGTEEASEPAPPQPLGHLGSRGRRTDGRVRRTRSATSEGL